MSRWSLYQTRTHGHHGKHSCTKAHTEPGFLRSAQNKANIYQPRLWVWKDNAAILAVPAAQAIWNVSLSNQRSPGAWKRGNVYPLPKVDIPVKPQDFRGICATSVIARTFVRVVYYTLVKKVWRITWIITSLRTEQKAVVQTRFLKCSLSFSKL